MRKTKLHLKLNAFQGRMQADLEYNQRITERLTCNYNREWSKGYDSGMRMVLINLQALLREYSREMKGKGK